MSNIEGVPDIDKVMKEVAGHEDAAINRLRNASEEVRKSIVQNGGETRSLREFVFAMHGLDIAAPRTAHHEQIAQQYTDIEARWGTAETYMTKVVAEIEKDPPRHREGSKVTIRSMGIILDEAGSAQPLHYTIEDMHSRHLGRMILPVTNYHNWPWQDELETAAGHNYILASTSRYAYYEGNFRDYGRNFVRGFGEIFAAHEFGSEYQNDLVEEDTRFLGRIATFRESLGYLVEDVPAVVSISN